MSKPQSDLRTVIEPILEKYQMELDDLRKEPLTEVLKPARKNWLTGKVTPVVALPRYGLMGQIRGYEQELSLLYSLLCKYDEGTTIIINGLAWTKGELPCEVVYDEMGRVGRYVERPSKCEERLV